jgi:putative oxidoreductase
MRDFGALILRLVFGGLLAGHGAQKLFGAFEGHGIQGTGKWFESMGFRPGERWATMAGMGEFGGGALTALGFMHPVGPLVTLAPMAVAWGRVHWNKPIWVTSGGGELPATNLAIAMSLALIGPGRWSVDHMFGMKAHPVLAAVVSACVAGGTMMALTQPTPEPTPQPETQPVEAEPVAAT